MERSFRRASEAGGRSLNRSSNSVSDIYGASTPFVNPGFGYSPGGRDGTMRSDMDTVVKEERQPAQKSESDDLRADARRNRCRILEAAESVFTSRGADASTDEVASAAGVGIGTVFRHFPTKGALLEALLIGKLR